ncbi:MAG: hypothetical protein KGD60_15135 [Candidatus Thorarchaeota archaeon]|nr:hypothetical protein [Candidatus Thorarchaeota archaeon]
MTNGVSMKICQKEIRSSFPRLCPVGCTLRDRERDIEYHRRIVLVPPPDRYIGVIISRDPTVQWASFYKHAHRVHKEQTQEYLHTSAIPFHLYFRISQFCESDPEIHYEEDLWDRLYTLLFQKTYWTHFHKCFTKPNSDFRFRVSNARLCANQWLSKELETATKNPKGVRFVVTLGNDAFYWMDNKRDSLLSKNPSEVELISFFHTSGFNNAIWSGATKNENQILRTRKAIRALLKYC